MFTKPKNLAIITILVITTAFAGAQWIEQAMAEWIMPDSLLDEAGIDDPPPDSAEENIAPPIYSQYDSLQIIQGNGAKLRLDGGSDSSELQLKTDNAINHWALYAHADTGDFNIWGGEAGPGSSGENVLTIDKDTGYLGININTESENIDEKLEVEGNAKVLPGNPVAKGSYDTSAIDTSWNQDVGGVYVVDNYLYVTHYREVDHDKSYLEKIDVSNPSSPTKVGSIKNGSLPPDLAKFAGAHSIFVAGKYAYVLADYVPAALHIIDISGATPVPAGVIYDDYTNGIAPLFSGGRVYVSGNYAYIASGKLFYDNNPNFCYGVLEIIEISDPANPVHRGLLKSKCQWDAEADLNAYFPTPMSIYVSGNYAYIAEADGGLIIIDIFDVKNPTYAGHSNGGYGGKTFIGSYGLDISGSYAYLTGGCEGVFPNFYQCLAIIDISNPTNPVHISSFLSEQTAYYFTPQAVFVSGNYAYITNWGDGSSCKIKIIDISDSADLTSVSEISYGSGACLDYEYFITIADNNLYVHSRADNLIHIFELSHLNSPTLVAGSASINDLQVHDNALFNNDLLVRSGLTVGGNTNLQSHLSVGGGTSFSGRVGIGTTNPLSELHVVGAITAINKNFQIDHPTKEGFDLVHSTLEGPEAAVFYRGEGKLVNGQAVVDLPEYFEALTRPEGRTVQLTPKGSEIFLLSASDVVNGKFTVYGVRDERVRAGQDRVRASDASESRPLEREFSWEVKAVRSDVEKLEVEKQK